MILELSYYGDPILRKKAEKIVSITEEIRSFVQDMVDTLEAAEDGVGLAAPQVGRSIALFVLQFPEDHEDGTWTKGKTQVFINPKILDSGQDESLMEEGCLSIPHVFETVSRPTFVKVQAEDLDGNVFIEEFYDFEARLVFHEYDHLEGTLFIDKIPLNKRKALAPALHRLQKMVRRTTVKSH